MNAPTMHDATEVLANPSAYADDELLHTALRQLRGDNPIVWLDHPLYRPFRAITQHADIMAIERDSDLMFTASRPLLRPAGAAGTESRRRLRGLSAVHPSEF